MWSTIHPSLAAWWVAGRLWLVGRPRFWTGESPGCWSRHQNFLHHLGTLQFPFRLAWTHWAALIVSALVALSRDFFTFWEGRWPGQEGGDGREDVGAAVCSAGCTCSHTSSGSGTWGGSIMSCSMSPRRVASSSGVGEVLHSPPMGL